MRSLIIAGGEFPPPSWLVSQYRPSDWVIAADRGGQLAYQAQIPVDVLVGDLDSLPPSCNASMFPAAQVHRFPCDKDYSDTELALGLAKEKGCREVLIVGALGGRFDHSLFNAISILELADQLSIRATLGSPDTWIRQLAPCQHWDLAPFPGWTCSLIALDAEVEVCLQGMLYSGPSIVLQRASTKGLSNIIQTPEARLTAERGRLIAVVSKPES